MSYLKQFGNNGENEETVVMTIRLPKSLYINFKAHCEVLGMPVSKGARLLIQGEMNGFKTSERLMSNELATTVESTKGTTKSNTKKATNKNTDSKRKPTAHKNINTNQIDTTEWQIEGKIACPVCKDWFSSTNYSKHARNKHESTRDEIFSNVEYQKIATQMVAEKKGTTTIKDAD